MKKFKEWLYEKEKTIDLEPKQPKKTATIDDDKGKVGGWQPEVRACKLDDGDKVDPSEEDTIWVKNADQWKEKDRTAL